MMFVRKAFLVVAVCAGVVSGFSTGAPPDVCLTMLPRHHADVQMSPSPFKIILSEHSYIPGQLIRITLGASDGRKLIGVMVNVHRESGDREQLFGTFEDFPQDKLVANNCLGGKHNFLTHRNKDSVTELKATWRAPATNVGNLTFRATFVQDFIVFWTDVETNIASQVQLPQQLINTVSISPISINVDDCGNQVGCLLYPVFCSSSNCDAGMTYTTTQDFVTLTIFAKTENYVSIGFSNDKSMGDDQTMTCLWDGSEVEVQNGYNPDYWNEKLYKVIDYGSL